ncbi:MAG: hypothetical protein WDM90_23380, partial [Ferruginibacter sp.]
MLTNYYNVDTSPDFLTFEFVSVGQKGSVTKVVRYSEINVKGFYNLGFGDKDPITGFLSDLTVTNNGDSHKVLATVAATLYAFTDNYPNVTVIATGSTQARTRLYRMGITNNLKAIEKDFVILGLTETDWEPFRKNITYGAFLVRRKL